MAAELRVIYETNFRDPVAMLRLLADAIEAGKHGAVGQLVVALLGDDLDVFAYGHDCTAADAVCLFQAAAHKLLRPIINHGAD